MCNCRKKNKSEKFAKKKQQIGIREVIVNQLWSMEFHMLIIKCANTILFVRPKYCLYCCAYKVWNPVGRMHFQFSGCGFTEIDTGFFDCFAIWCKMCVFNQQRESLFWNFMCKFEWTRLLFIRALNYVQCVIHELRHSIIQF